VSDNKYNYSGLVISLVSHGQGQLLKALLDDLLPLIVLGADVVVTLNIPESEDFLDEFDAKIKIIRNFSPKGFGSNHNQAFRLAKSKCKWFAVINPDIRCDASIFSILISTLTDSSIGISVPRVINPQGTIEDSVRKFPTIPRIFNRIVKRLLGKILDPDYDIKVDINYSVDWAGGMFMIFSVDSYSLVDGFDERYFMYLEDADICRRLRDHHKLINLVPTVRVVHDARRASSKNLMHLKWHLRSMMRFLFL
jgi:N-acetylglucosaminyl-diphospho-decaprenol L-rhamnosyltransferase